ncbi:LysR family transcriptional regulator [Snodgrassella gandavensis]|uniref:LysR family transcriptional regulator n=1 Tax=Snodgrassella gandavensis TaxID=2946698 RepID=UPI001EF5B010|nr:LysR family transcriptional regulator [Snodgrassella gandavensis]
MKNHLQSMHLASLELFLVAAENENFSAAAEYLNITPAAVSRSIKRLEERIGIELFSRNTRKIKLTPEGKIYYKKCSEILESLISTEREIKLHKESVAGRLKISVPESFFNYKMAPCLNNFCKQYPQLKLDFHVTNRNIDFVAETYDLSVRLIQPETKLESFLIKKTLYNAASGLFASPEYLASNSRIQCPSDIKNHQCINFSISENNKKFSWYCVDNHSERNFHYSNQIQVFDNILATKFLALNNCGIVHLFKFAVHDELQNNKLVEILPEYSINHLWQFCFLYPESHRKSAKLRVFTDYFIQNIK